jgi:hypothetical protein
MVRPMNEDSSLPRAMTSPPVEKSIRLDPSIADRIASAALNRPPVPGNVAARREQNVRARLSKGEPVG